MRWVLIGIMVFCLIFIIVMMVKALNFGKTDYSKNQTLNSKDVIDGIYGNVKDFLPVVEFHDYCYEMSGNIFKGIIECSSINYNLMSASEQRLVDVLYFDFLNSLNFPIEIYIQTREFNTENMIRELDKNIANVLPKYPALTEYATLYRENISNLTNITNNNKIKKKFIVVTFSANELLDTSELNEQEIKDFIIEELYRRCSLVIQGLNGVGLQAKMLDKRGIAECIYSYFHRNNSKIAQDIISGYYNTLFVMGMRKDEPTSYEMLCNILNRASNEINSTLISSKTSSEEIAFYNELLGVFENVKLNFTQRGL